MELDNHLLAVVEPAILPTEIKIDNLGEDGGGSKQTKAIGTLKPLGAPLKVGLVEKLY